MGRELINRVSVKKDGVYISTHSSNDTAPFTSYKNNRLTKAFIQDGQKGLDKELLSWGFDYVEFVGRHKSIAPYKKAINKFWENRDNRPLINEINAKTELIDTMFYKRETLDSTGNIRLNDLILERKELEDKKLDIALDTVQYTRDSIISEEMELD